MKFVHTPDFLHPIDGSKNRDECLLLPFHRCFKNTNMSVIINLVARMGQDQDICDLFPNLLEMARASALEMYAYSVMFPDPHLMLQDLSNGALSVDTAIAFAEEFMKPLHIDRLHKTRIEVMINRLIHQPFIKKLYIQADTVTMEIANYIKQEILQYIELSRSKCELHLVQGLYIEAFRDIPDLTTAFLNTSAQLDEIETAFGTEALQGKCFVIMDNRFDYEADTSVGSEPILRHRNLDKFKRYVENKVCAVSYMYPYPFASME